MDHSDSHKKLISRRFNRLIQQFPIKSLFFINLSRLTDNICDVWISSKRELDENGTSARGCKALIFCTESETIKSRVEEGKEFWKLIGPRHRFNCHFGDTHSQ